MEPSLNLAPFDHISLMVHTWPWWLSGGSKPWTWPGCWVAEFRPMDLPIWAHQEGPTRAWMHNINCPNSQGHCGKSGQPLEEMKEPVLLSPQDSAWAPSRSPVPASHAHWAPLLSPLGPWVPWEGINVVLSLSANPKLSEETHRCRKRQCRTIPRQKW